MHHDQQKYQQRNPRNDPEKLASHRSRRTSHQGIEVFRPALPHRAKRPVHSYAHDAGSGREVQAYTRLLDQPRQRHVLKHFSGDRRMPSDSIVHPHAGSAGIARWPPQPASRDDLPHRTNTFAQAAYRRMESRHFSHQVRVSCSGEYDTSPAPLFAASARACAVEPGKCTPSASVKSNQCPVACAAPSDTA